jgi:hypothetical protein
MEPVQKALKMIAMHGLDNLCTGFFAAKHLALDF